MSKHETVYCLPIQSPALIVVVSLEKVATNRDGSSASVALRPTTTCCRMRPRCEPFSVVITVVEMEVSQLLARRRINEPSINLSFAALSLALITIVSCQEER